MGGVGVCIHHRQDAQRVGETASGCCTSQHCLNEVYDTDKPVQQPTLPLDRCCDDGNCLCGGALLEKAGTELQLLHEFMADGGTVSADAGMLLSEQSAVEHPRALVVFQGGHAIGRALRLRIESLLI
jgi:hypothetical protein